MRQIRNVTCAECGTGFEAVDARAKYCGPRCKTRAYRRPAKRGALEGPPAPTARPMTAAEVLDDLDAALELLPGDIATLEARFPDGADPVMDELIGGMGTLRLGLERVREWVGRGHVLGTPGRNHE